ncbi:MAG: oxygenase MpaB family protein, partial [Rhodoferax sp.]|nr:oxygenase MpaB family protein [Rhodoferax sp.]
IRQTAAMVFPVMMKGGLMDASGAGVAQVLKVRLIHATIRHLILRGEPQTVRGQVAPLLQAGAPTGMHAALMSHGWDVDRQGLPCNQIELAYTLLTFSYSFLKGMRTLGLGLPRADEEAYLHAWNVMGHVLGVRRELMADTMDEAASLFERIQAQARGQAVSPDARPALGRALMHTMERTIRLPVVRGIPVPLARWLIGPDTAHEIGVDERVSWPTRLVFLAGRLLVRLIDTVVRLFSPGFSLSRMFTRIVGYHLLTRFLLDQTRPLNLPDQLLNPLTDTVAAWSDDPGAPGWLNRLEDRWTTTGHWLPAHGVGTTKRPVPDAEAVAS